MDLWNAQSLFMRFFPLVVPDDKPKGICIYITFGFLVKHYTNDVMLGFHLAIKISPPCDSNFEDA